MKSWKQIGLLLGVLAILGGLASWDEWKTKKDSEAETKKNHLFAFDPNVVAEFSATSRAEAGKARETVKIQKSGESWTIVEPVKTPADQKTVENFLKGIADYKYERAIEVSPPKGMAEFGLDDSARKISLTLGGKDAGIRSIFIGINTPVGYSVYSRIDGDNRVFVGSQYLETSAAKGLRDFREKLFAKIAEAKLKALTIRRKGFPEIKLVKGDGGFEVTDGTKSFKGDEIEVSSFVHAINEASAINFADAPLPSDVASAISSNQRFYEISWDTEGAAPQTMVVGKAGKKLWAAINPDVVAYELPDTFEDKVRKQADDFRNRRIFSFDSASISKVEYDGSTFESVAGDWYAAADVTAAKAKKEGSDEPKVAGQIRSLVVDLEFAKTIEFIDSKDAEMVRILAEAPQHKLTLTFSDAKIPAITIEAWKKPNTENFLIRYSGSPDLFVVSKDVFEPKTAEEHSEGFAPAGDTSAVDPSLTKDAG
jgi:hypothetical protein